MHVWKIPKMEVLVIIYLPLSFLSPLSSDKQFHTKFLQLKSTNKNARYAIYKISLFQLFLTACARR